MSKDNTVDNTTTPIRQQVVPQQSLLNRFSTTEIDTAIEQHNRIGRALQSQLPPGSPNVVQPIPTIAQTTLTTSSMSKPPAFTIISSEKSGIARFNGHSSDNAISLASWQGLMVDYIDMLVNPSVVTNRTKYPEGYGARLSNALEDISPTDPGRADAEATELFYRQCNAQARALLKSHIGPTV